MKKQATTTEALVQVEVTIDGRKHRITIDPRALRGDVAELDSCYRSGDHGASGIKLNTMISCTFERA